MDRILKYKVAIVMLFLFLLLFTACQTQDEFRKTGTHWTVGFDKREIVPEDITAKTYYIAGYDIDKPATGILDPQYVRAVWMDDNSGRGGVVMAVIDCIGLTRTDVEHIRSLLKDFQKKSGCRSINIFSTHTHAGIDTLGIWGPLLQSGKDEEFMEMLYKNTVDAVVGAWQNRKDGVLFGGSVEVEGILNDSRDPQVYSKTLFRFRFEPYDNSRGLQMIHFGAHPEALRSENTLVSADFPAYMGKRIMEMTNDEFVYFTGAIGGLINTKRLSDESGRQLDVYKSTEKTGEILADAALSIDNERVLMPSFNIKTKVFESPLENPVYLIEKFLGILSTKAVKGGGEPFNLSVRTEVTYAEIGDVKAIFVPGELFPELAYGGDEAFIPVHESVQNPKTFAEMLGDSNFLVFGLSNDEIGYILPPNNFLLDEKLPYIENAVDKYGRRHYEETNSIGPKTAENLANALMELLASCGITR
ncbi:MAG: hypothetical protein ACOX3Q_00610 [Clostridia bacterium]|jgi:hypothetical protein